MACDDLIEREAHRRRAVESPAAFVPVKKDRDEFGKHASRNDVRARNRGKRESINFANTFGKDLWVIAADEIAIRGIATAEAQTIEERLLHLKAAAKFAVRADCATQTDAEAPGIMPERALPQCILLGFGDYRRQQLCVLD